MEGQRTQGWQKGEIASSVLGDRRPWRTPAEHVTDHVTLPPPMADQPCVNITVPHLVPAILLPEEFCRYVLSVPQGLITLKQKASEKSKIAVKIPQGKSKVMVWVRVGLALSGRPQTLSSLGRQIFSSMQFSTSSAHRRSCSTRIRSRWETNKNGPLLRHPRNMGSSSTGIETHYRN